METSNLEQTYSNYVLAHEANPWLGKLTVTIRSKSDVTTAWNQLLLNSVHVNHLVTLNKSWRLVPEKVQQHMVNGRIIVNMSADPFRGWEERTVAELAQITDQFVVLSGDSVYFDNPKPNICYFPFWYLNQRYTYDPVAVIDQPRRYVVSSLNKAGRYHRIENYIKLRAKPYFDQLFFSAPYEYDAEQIRRQTHRSFYRADIMTEFDRIRPSLPQLPPQGDFHNIDSEAYTDSYINLVTETSIHEGTIFNSEKTWKPFMSGQFGLWLSNPGTVAFLRTIGLDVFDDLLDGHAYDSETNLNLRIDAMHATIDRVMSQDLGSVFESTLARREANIDRFYGAELEAVLTRQCQAYSAIINI